MKKIIFTLLIISTFTLVKAQLVFDKTHTSTSGSFYIEYPSAWSLDDLATTDYLIKLTAPDNVANIFVKKTKYNSAIDAKTIVTKYIEPAWLKAEATIIPLKEEMKQMTASQLEMKNIDSGYSTIVKAVRSGKVEYTGYIVMVKGLFIYEIKYEASGTTPPDIIKMLPKVGLTFRAL